ncbi:MAG: hypothetical protein WKG01_28060 [Kofleriaceae bacterium]
MITISNTHLTLWSVSGLEGTLAQPRLVVKREDKGALADLSRTLDEIVGKRLSVPKAEADRSILVMVEAEIPMQALAEVLGAVRATAEGKELFTDVMFTLAFQ